jgi:trehalose/maltose hydrolase-like predicted phosphorylase
MNERLLAWDVMERILWWSEKYPYWPQCIWAAKQDYSHWEQPANRTALAFIQAIVFGMFGLTLKEKRPVFEPHIPEGIGKVKLSNVRVLGETLEYEHAGAEPRNAEA